MAARTRGEGYRAERVAMESIDRTRLNRAPHMTFKHSLDPDAEGVGRALEYFRRVAKATNDVLVRASANERGYFCAAACIHFTPYAPNVKGSAPANVLP